jgi:uncharacterized protein YecT (DUF1311 family)
MLRYSVLLLFLILKIPSVVSVASATPIFEAETVANDLNNAEVYYDRANALAGDKEGAIEDYSRASKTTTILSTLRIANSNRKDIALSQERKIDYDTMYSKCSTDVGGGNNATVDACSNRTSYEAKKEITKLYKRIYAYYVTDLPKDAKEFEQTQRAWITYRNGQCYLAGAHIGSPMYSYCPMRLNIARVKELRELAEELYK